MISKSPRNMGSIPTYDSRSVWASSPCARFRDVDICRDMERYCSTPFCSLYQPDGMPAAPCSVRARSRSRARHSVQGPEMHNWIGAPHDEITCVRGHQPPELFINTRNYKDAYPLRDGQSRSITLNLCAMRCLSTYYMSPSRPGTTRNIMVVPRPDLIESTARTAPTGTLAYMPTQRISAPRR